MLSSSSVLVLRHRHSPRFRAGFLLVFSLVFGCSAREGPPGSNPLTPAPVAMTPTLPPAPQTARYRLVFTSTWTAATHPQDAPRNPHFSPLIGGTHSSAVSFWRDGSPATEGIRRMAERGAVAPLDDEIRTAIAAGHAEHLLTGAAIGSRATTMFEFDISQRHPLVTLVTMVAPSPDWFVGTSDLSLFENGTWLEERVVLLVPWDAGTDSGNTFEADDVVTTPRQPVSLITTPPLAVNGRVESLGTFTFMRVGG